MQGSIDAVVVGVGSGGTLTGALVLAGDGATNLSPVTVQQFNNTVTQMLPLAGGTMTGPLTLAADPAANLQAATKQYVDNHVAAAIAAALAAK